MSRQEDGSDGCCDAVYMPARLWLKLVFLMAWRAVLCTAAGVAASAGVALVLHVLGARMSFYAQPALLVPLYALPGKYSSRIRIRARGIDCWCLSVRLNNSLRRYSAGGDVGGCSSGRWIAPRAGGVAPWLGGVARLERRAGAADRVVAGAAGSARPALRLLAGSLDSPRALVATVPSGSGHVSTAADRRRTPRRGLDPAGPADGVSGAQLHQHVRAHHGSRRHGLLAGRRECLSGTARLLSFSDSRLPCVQVMMSVVVSSLTLLTFSWMLPLVVAAKRLNVLVHIRCRPASVPLGRRQY